VGDASVNARCVKEVFEGLLDGLHHSGFKRGVKTAFNAERHLRLGEEEGGWGGCQAGLVAQREKKEGRREERAGQHMGQGEGGSWARGREKRAAGGMGRLEPS
jgi:hypothetical protein